MHYTLTLFTLYNYNEHLKIKRHIIILIWSARKDDFYHAMPKIFQNHLSFLILKIKKRSDIKKATEEVYKLYIISNLSLNN